MIHQKHRLVITMSLLLSLASATSNAYQVKDDYAIPYLKNAKIFAQFTDELPAVINYFTAHSQEEIITFYQDKFGKPISRELKRQRLTLYFTHKDRQLRVVISQQGNKNQVDILMSK
ncbi:hypothetical protein Q4493_10290 [Colwellia sp. 1_MG-2023]|uniref:hypothetical protein n=1 Tax=Colwellia sp. 1_MG-2023 TaxID=3062649 RepID=UPI0026E387D3|nr:hypothetical protein [Colwellia sp. 1_MG-2023]MDO6446164.1 hypothetical protein [Colwellia sp. 1_MG-2023]